MNKDEFLEHELKANEEAAKSQTIIDLTDADSKVYRDGSEILRESTIPVRKNIDPEGLPEIQTLRTFKADVTDAVKTDNLSMAKIAIAEGRAQEKKMGDVSVKADKNWPKIFLIASVVCLIVGGVGAIGYYFYQKIPKDSAPVTAPVKKDIIYSESKDYIDITKQNGRQFLVELAGKLDKPNKVENRDAIEELVPVVGNGEGNFIPVNLFQFMSTTELVPPEELSRSFLSRFFLGSWNDGSKREPFLMVFSDSYDVAFSGLLKWEGLLGRDLKAIFGREIDKAKGPFHFEDEVVANQDARSYKDAEGKTIFFYSIVDQKIIIFAESSGALSKIKERIRESRIR